MTLINYKLGDLIEQVDKRNGELKYSLDDLKGISIKKMFIESKADMDGVSLKPYKLVEHDKFAYVTVTSRNGEKITLAHNTDNKTYIVSSSYVVFEVKRKDLLLSDYLFMFFNRAEFDRYSRYHSWGSARETFMWEDMCDIDIELPPIEIQQKYVDIYNSMIANQKAYEKGLEELQFVSDAIYDKLKKDKTNSINLGSIIEKNDKRNTAGFYGEKNVKGISNTKEFIKTKANVSNTDLTKFKIVDTNEFAYNSRTDGRDMLVLALNETLDGIIVTWNYNSFRIKPNKLNEINPKFLYAWLKRKEFDRLVRFMSWGSSQELFSWDSLCEIMIPFPSIDIQNSIAAINDALVKRKKLNLKLKDQIKDISPILIKGSLEEARKS